MKKIFLLLASSLLLSSSFAGNQLLKDGKPIYQSNVKTGEQITAMTLIINNYNEFKQEWETTAAEYKPHATLASKAKIGDSVHLITFFSHCLPDEESNCNLSFKVRIFKGDNLIYDSPKTQQQVAYQGDNMLLLSNMVLGSTFEAKDSGIYNYEVEVTDENADDIVHLKTSITVTEK